MMTASNSSTSLNLDDTFNSLYDTLYKVVIIGDSGVGKSNILSRISQNSFSADCKSTIGVEFATKTITVNNQRVKTQLWDTAGQERYRAITTAYYRGAVGVFLVYDVTSRSSFENLARWLSEIDVHANADAIVFLIANKSDLTHLRAVKQTDGQKFASEQNIAFFMEVSALDTTNIDLAFTTLVEAIHARLQRPEATTETDLTAKLDSVKIDITNTAESRPKTKCCA